MNLAVGVLCCREGNLSTAVAAIKFMTETVGNENLEIAKEVQTALKLRTSQRLKILSQVLSICKA
jgi:hypothetical protein